MNYSGNRNFLIILCFCRTYNWNDRLPANCTLSVKFLLIWHEFFWRYRFFA